MWNGNERFFIVAESSEDYYMELGWIFYHDPSKFQETETTIELVNEFVREHHKSAPKNLLVEITKADYDLIARTNELGYDNSKIIAQIINSRKDDTNDS